MSFIFNITEDGHSIFYDCCSGMCVYVVMGGSESCAAWCSHLHAHQSHAHITMPVMMISTQ